MTKKISTRRKKSPHQLKKIAAGRVVEGRLPLHIMPQPGDQTPYLRGFRDGRECYRYEVREIVGKCVAGVLFIALGLFALATGIYG